MDLTMFGSNAPGRLVDIAGSDETGRTWRHRAFVPAPLPTGEPPLAGRTYRAVADARASLAALDSTARQLPNPTLLRKPTLRREAQSTSALEGTYAPLSTVLVADDDDPATGELKEILNYVRAANHGFASVSDGRPITVALLGELQALLMSGTPLAGVAGRSRQIQVVIGRRANADVRAPLVHNARFVPAPAGDELDTGLRALTDWLDTPHPDIDPVVAAALVHYQFETLHPFQDGNGRVGRLLIVLQLLADAVLNEPTLTVSPWFEARRTMYYERLLGVSTRGDWDSWVSFFADGLRQAADTTHAEMRDLVALQAELHAEVRSSHLRADSAHALIDCAVANPSFTVRRVESELDLSYGRANRLVGQLVDMGILAAVDPDAYKRRFYAPRVLEVLTRSV